MASDMVTRLAPPLRRLEPRGRRLRGGRNTRTLKFYVDFAAAHYLPYVQATLWTDGVNAGRVGSDYRRTTKELEADGPLRLTLAPGGGAVVRLRRQ